MLDTCSSVSMFATVAIFSLRLSTSLRSISSTLGMWALWEGVADNPFYFFQSEYLGVVSTQRWGQCMVGESSSRLAHAGDLVDFRWLTCLATPAFLNVFKFDECTSGRMLPLSRATRDAVRP